MSTNLIKMLVYTYIFSTASCSKKIEPLFVQLSENQSGVHFKNGISESDTNNILTYLYYYNGGGVAIADFNMDGLPDVFFTGNETTSALYLNKGGLKFKDVTLLAGVSTNQWITGATVVDINGDQMPDVYLSVSGNQKAENRKNLLFVHQGLENGVPSFIEKAAEYGIADTGYATQSVFFDADLDGDLDLYILNHGNEREKVNTPLPEEKGAPESDKFYVNNGDGSFSDISEKAGISDMAYGLGIAIADVNSDGLPDIFVANDFIANDKLYINQGNLSFNDEVDNYLPYQSYNSMGCDFGDMDNDGFPELWVLDMLPSNMNDFRQMAGSMTSFKWAYMLKMGYSPQYMRNTFYQHKGIIPNVNAFVFQESARQKSVEATDWSWAVLMADFNMDGLKDGVVTNGYFRDITDIDFIQFSKSFSTFKNLKNANISLLNEIRKRPSHSAENNLFLQSKSGVFNRSSLINNNEPDCSQGMAYADFDLDGDLDLAINHLNKPASILENKSNLQKDFNFLQIKLKGSTFNYSGIGCKITCFTKQQKQVFWQFPVKGFQSHVSEIINIGLGKSQRVDSLFVKWPNGSITSYYNIQGNQKMDVAISDKSKLLKYSSPIEDVGNKPFISESVWLKLVSNEMSARDKSAYPLLISRSVLLKNPLAVNQETNDDILEFYVNSKLYYAKNGIVEDSTILDATFDNSVRKAIFLDWNGDGRNDLVRIHGSEKGKLNKSLPSISVFLGQKNKTWTKLSNVRLPSGENFRTARAVEIKKGEFLLLCGGGMNLKSYPKGDKSVLYHIKKGQMAQIGVPELSGLLPVRDVAWADLDKNGLQDMILVGEWASPIIFFQTRYLIFEKYDLGGNKKNLQGWWRSVLPADVDGDGDIDLLLGNEGLNNRFKISLDNPLYLFSKDWDNNHSNDPIHALSLDEKIYPVHFLNEMVQQIPVFRFKYNNYKAFTESTVEQVVTKNGLKKSEKFEVNEFASVWLENKGKGSFVSHYLPAILQSAPLNGFIEVRVDDVNPLILCFGNDEKADIHTGLQLGLDPVLLQWHNGLKYLEGKNIGLFSRGIINEMVSFGNSNSPKILISKEEDGNQTISTIKNNFSHINFFQHE